MATKKDTTKKDLETPKARPARAAGARPLKNVPTERIATRAYQLYAERGGEHGRDQDDWLRAEQELKKDDGSGHTAH